MAASRFLFAWRHALASEEGPPSSTDRLVALALSLFFNREGLSAWPNQETLALKTGLTDRAVGKALARLVEAKWLERQERKSPRGNRHRRYGYEYRARLPSKLARSFWNGERRSLFIGRDPTKQERKVNSERRDISMANAVRTNTSGELMKGTASKKEPTSSGVLDAEIIAAFSADAQEKT